VNQETVIFVLRSPIRTFRIIFTLREGCSFDVEAFDGFLELKGGTLFIGGEVCGSIVLQDKCQWKYTATYAGKTFEDYFSSGAMYPYTTDEIDYSSAYVHAKFKELAGYELLGAVMKIVEIIDGGV